MSLEAAFAIQLIGNMTLAPRSFPLMPFYAKLVDHRPGPLSTNEGQEMRQTGRPLGT